MVDAVSGSLHQGRLVHGFLMESGLEPGVKAGNVLLNMYVKCGELEIARGVFERMLKRDTISWNSIISGYVQSNREAEALELFRRMNAEANSVTWVAALNACAALADLKQGQEIHKRITMKKSSSEDPGLAHALFNMYSRCGELDAALRIFEAMKVRDVIAWTLLIGAYLEQDLAPEAMKSFERMLLEGVRGNRVTLTTVLEACVNVGDLRTGKLVHRVASEDGSDRVLGVGNALISLYTKSGEFEAALMVFSKLLRQDTVSWNSLITGFAQHGCGETCTQTFRFMQLAGVFPDSITFLVLLNRCSHSGNLEEAQAWAQSMQQDYGIHLTTEQLGSVIDLLGRKGELDLAEKLVDRSSLVMLTAFLGACRTQNDMNRANQAVSHVAELNPPDTYASAALVLTLNLGTA